MITVFGNFENSLSIGCKNATAAVEGEFSGTVTYTVCGDEFSQQVTVLPGRPRILGCIERIYTADPWVNVDVFEDCESGGGFDPAPDPEDPDPKDPDPEDPDPKDPIIT